MIIRGSSLGKIIDALEMTEVQLPIDLVYADLTEQGALIAYSPSRYRDVTRQK